MREMNAPVAMKLAAAWARDAAMEHASIAAFARFTLELLAVGAPASLVLATQQAACDEVEHAKACFSIASRLAGRRLAPGPLDVGGAAPSPDLVAIAVGTFKEGCVGETLAAALAEARLVGARDQDIRRALARIVVEEAKHAQLGWRFVSWAVERGGDPVRRAIGAAFEEVRRTTSSHLHPDLHDVPDETLRAHGLLDAETARAVTERTLCEVARQVERLTVEPLVAA
jgi:hypothetical protein